jgi:NAD(P)-dependent dehydrogenase (short-subunit alcohol dehydrogenase family)
MDNRNSYGLESTVVLVTGATSGIGKASAKAFLKEGAKVACVGRDSEKGKRLIEELDAYGSGKYTFIQCDVTEIREVENAVRRTVDYFGGIDVLFNNAGSLLVRDCADTTEEEWDLMFDTNVKSTFMFCKFAIPHLKKTKGTIINNGSELALRGAPSYTAYCASKGGIVLFTKSLALECAPFGIRVNCICPGATQTPMLDNEFVVLAKNSTVEATRKMILDGIPMARISSPDEIAKVVVFLASRESSYMTGSVVSVDGGSTLK